MGETPTKNLLTLNPTGHCSKGPRDQGFTHRISPKILKVNRGAKHAGKVLHTLTLLPGSDSTPDSAPVRLGSSGWQVWFPELAAAPSLAFPVHFVHFLAHGVTSPELPCLFMPSVRTVATAMSFPSGWDL